MNLANRVYHGILESNYHQLSFLITSPPPSHQNHKSKIDHPLTQCLHCHQNLLPSKHRPNTSTAHCHQNPIANTTSLLPTTSTASPNNPNQNTNTTIHLRPPDPAIPTVNHQIQPLPFQSSRKGNSKYQCSKNC